MRELNQSPGGRGTDNGQNRVLLALRTVRSRAGERVAPTWFRATVKQLGDLFIPGKAVEFPDVFDLIKGKQPAQAGMFTSLDIDQAQEGIGY